MKVVVQENRAYKLYAEVTELSKKEKYLKLTSTYDGSRIPNEERKVFEATFSDGDFHHFVEFLKSQV